MAQFAHTPSSAASSPYRYGDQTPTRASGRLSIAQTPHQKPPTSTTRIRPGSSMASFNAKTPSSAIRRPMTPRASNIGINDTGNSSTGTLRARSSLANISTPARASTSQMVSRPSSSLSFSSSSTSNNNVTYTGTIKVAVRPRPLDEQHRSTNTSWTVNKYSNSIFNDEVGEFSFDNVFEPMVKNLEVYSNSVEPVVSQCLDGYNGTVFAYGMTGSGKTYSMQGTKSEAGLIHMCANQIFEKATEDRKDYKISCSYLEIYNEKLFDLLNPESANSLKNSLGAVSNAADDLRIRDDSLHGVKVVGLTEYDVFSKDELLSAIDQGDSIRKTGGTDFNARSSRSHAVLLIRIRVKDNLTGLEKYSTLCLCDLAGSERGTSQLERRKEGSFINKSLLALSTVISKLSQGSSNHIPYRDSKLTRLLQPSLSGNSIVSILCTIHLSKSTIAETINTLRFASRAKNILMNVKKNEFTGSVEKDKFIEQLMQENERQKQEIEQLQKEQKSEPTMPSPNTKRLHTTTTDDIKVNGQVVAQLTAENKILNEQVENLKRLNDTQNMNSVIGNNEHLQQLIQLDLADPRINEVVFKLETYHTQQLAQIEEMKSYITHLEQQLKQSEFQKSLNQNPRAVDSDMTAAIPELLKEQEEEIVDLKRQLKSKDSIIKALRSSSKVRDMVSGGSVPDPSSLVDNLENANVGSGIGSKKTFLKSIENTVNV